MTPIIMSGARKNLLELREQSINGILRWWFRFYGSLKYQSLQELRKRESEIFGSTTKAKRFYIKILQEPQSRGKAYLCMNDRRKKGEKGAAVNYSERVRTSYAPNQEFILNFKFMPHFPKEHEKELKNSLMCLSLFGGIGARWRRGFGSIIVKEFAFYGEELEGIGKEINKRLEELNIKNSLKIKPFEEFINFRNTNIFLIKPKNSFWDSYESAMNDLRDNFYRALKHELKISELSYSPRESRRKASPLIIQIKKNVKNHYFGVILIWQEWPQKKAAEDFLTKLEKYEFIGINLPGE
ncbi:type III-B CRISPR module RAMP protein Cmr1 [Caldanaerobacter subterraneus]|uniref:type III-B CRISPR module RAMP protein Cmr1 n=1 Tax=Caldanaerobacter subterraneus TaxID=911092 RepID=UPI001F300ED4|nr:type III-B CRISPR module RAMP protein Cmr1 [Caldanaerobacter subterraneus]